MSYERYVFFSRNQGANEAFDAYLGSLRKLEFSCEFTQLEEQLIRDIIILATKYGGVHILATSP